MFSSVLSAIGGARLAAHNEEEALVSEYAAEETCFVGKKMIACETYIFEEEMLIIGRNFQKPAEKFSNRSEIYTKFLRK